MKCRCSNCGWLSVNPSGAMFCGYSDKRIWEDESCAAWKDKDEPQTNYDLLISKTPEELAKWIAEIAGCNGCEEMHGFRMCDAAPGKACEDYWTGWLRNNVEEE